MANLNISAAGDLYKIELDTFDWTGLQVNGTAVKKSADGTYTYTQTSPGSVRFVATASNLQIVNPDNAFLLAGTKHSHMAVIKYSAPSANTVQIEGTLVNWPANVNFQFGQGPFRFAQGRLTAKLSGPAATA